MDTRKHQIFWDRVEKAMRSLTIAGFVFAAILGAFLFTGWPQKSTKSHGVTWSTPYAYSLGLNPIAGLVAVLDELGVRNFRIPAYWTDVERQQGVYDFHFVQEPLDEISKRNGTVVLAVGARLPRWPECWVPDWAKSLDLQAREQAQLSYVRSVYEHFKNNPTIIAWQVENEPMFNSYVKCPGLTNAIVLEEMRMLRAEEAKRGDRARPIVTTDSGELSAWLDYASEIDGLGVSVYRVVTNPTFGVTHWILPPWFYTRKAWLTNLYRDHGMTFVSEFQMEPWSDKPLIEATQADFDKTLSIKQMQSNFEYAQEMDMPIVYFWGAEWWYWMKEKRGQSQYWEEAKNFF